MEAKSNLNIDLKLTTINRLIFILSYIKNIIYLKGYISDDLRFLLTVEFLHLPIYIEIFDDPMIKLIIISIFGQLNDIVNI